MRWPFTRKATRPNQKVRVDGVEFVGAQEGPNESTLKAALVELFSQEHTVTRAYLARVKYGEAATVHVALCLCTAGGANDKLVEQIRRLFASAFSADMHLDILFIEQINEAALVDVCGPFFNANAS